MPAKKVTGSSTRGPQISTVVSDGVLVLVCLLCVKTLIGRGNVYAALGIFYIGVAALAGTLRFGLLPSIATLHDFLSCIGRRAGIPLIGAGFYFGAVPVHPNQLAVISLVAVVSALLPGRIFDDLPGAVGFGYAAYAMFMRQQWLGLVGCVSIMATGLLLAKRTHVAGLKQIDFLHYILASGLWSMTQAL